MLSLFGIMGYYFILAPIKFNFVIFLEMIKLNLTLTKNRHKMILQFILYLIWFLRRSLDEKL